MMTQPFESSFLTPYLYKEIQQRQTLFLKGWQHYKDAKRPCTLSKKKYHQDPMFSILGLEEKPPKTKAVLFVPSGLNTPDIFFLKTLSWRRWWQNKGYQPLALSWGPKHATVFPFYSLKSVLHSALIPAYKKLLMDFQEVVLMGYCAGATFVMTLLLSQPPRHNVKAVLMAPAWDIKEPFFLDPDPKDPWIYGHHWRNYFFYQNPVGVYRKFCRFAGFPVASLAYEHFVAVEDWSQKMLAMPKPFVQNFHHFVHGSLEDKKMLMDFNNPHALSHRVFTAFGREDHLIPVKTMDTLRRDLCLTENHLFPTGHLGLMASKKTFQQITKNLAMWLEDR